MYIYPLHVLIMIPYREGTLLYWRRGDPTTTLIRLCLVLIFPSFLYDHQHQYAAHAASKFLSLPVGFNVSLSSLAEYQDLFIRALTGQEDYFIPLLSSPSFELDDQLGYSFGFLFTRIGFGSALNSSIYLAVCAGWLGNSLMASSGNYYKVIRVLGQQDSVPARFDTVVVADGLVTPVLFINRPERPLGSIYNSTLTVVPSKELQLRDYNGSVVWRVPNVGMMEMQDTGELLIYTSSSTTRPLPNHVVWRSSDRELPTDTLFQWQKMKPGMELYSNNSAYMARMETGGLVLYLMNAHFTTQYQPPYWIYPVPFPVDRVGAFTNLNTLIASSPSCGEAYSRLGMSSWNFYLANDAGYNCSDKDHPGTYSCINVFGGLNMTQFEMEISRSVAAQARPPQDSWSFMRLEDDGRLHVYVVTRDRSAAYPISVQQYALDALGGEVVYLDPNRLLTAYPERLVPAVSWGACDVPMACGPLGVCTQDALYVCACPLPLDPLNPRDLSQGCKRGPSIRLPQCSENGMEHMNTTQYVELNNTSTIFLFSEWEFASLTASTVENCQKLCSSNCSCNGFFYQTNGSACFFMTDEISLLNLVEDKVLPYPRMYSSFLKQQRLPTLAVASTYVTYIKVALTISSNSTSQLGSNTSNPKNTRLLVASIAPIVLSCLVVLGVVAYCNIQRVRRIRRSKQASLMVEQELQSVLPSLPSRFTYKELAEATENFNNLLGEGGCGSVYGGILPGGVKVAVKILETSNLEGQRKQFLAELATIGRTSHQNIVHLVGFCWDATHRFLVYEYVERGSLDRWLFKMDAASDNDNIEEGKSLAEANTDANRETATVMSLQLFHEWRTRYDVALGIARGLSYLHEECPQPILHFDIKPQNILLDNAFVPKLADFGMSRFIQRDVSKVVTAVRGTPGYIAPEWLSHGAVGKESDVYSMGMVMLEIVGGRRNVDLALFCRDGSDGQAAAGSSSSTVEDEGAWHFPSWVAMKCDGGMMMEVVDNRLRNVDEEQIRRLVYTALWCIMEDPKKRPSATMVVQWLEGSSEVKRAPYLSSIIRAAIVRKSLSSNSFF